MISLIGLLILFAAWIVAGASLTARAIKDSAEWFGGE